MEGRGRLEPRQARQHGIEQHFALEVALAGATHAARHHHRLLAHHRHQAAADLELVQQGLRSRFAIRGRYSWQEGAQVQFNRWLTPRYQKAWAALKAGDWAAITKRAQEFVAAAGKV